MKFTITMKDPDGVYTSVHEAASESVEEMDFEDPDEELDIVERREEKINTFIQSWIEYGEYVTLEFDTEAGTCTVKKRR